jgi:hypothetical protein
MQRFTSKRRSKGNWGNWPEAPLLSVSSLFAALPFLRAGIEVGDKISMSHSPKPVINAA